MREHTYIWINPVSADMYAPETMTDLLSRHNCTAVQCRDDWAGSVRGKYRKLVESESRIVSDARCPMAAALVRELQQDAPRRRLSVAEIEPILIHAARELAQREDLRNSPKLITTPCRALAEMGNALRLEGTTFLSWKDLLEQWGECPSVRKLEKSPIPPGFFDGTGIPVHKITGREEIAAYVRGCCGEERLVEMLYCKDGCHNGDGVLFDE